ncbi:MAG: hypothetical protein A2131_00255 [Candidatus Sungbacteria bacterium GWC2_49_10]|uniref:Uncharacterized protein n=2 Tax=Parcubacteria group TaxID=1794811 RepID=A0A0G1WKR6_9BACT|nr:MAG: hypothetical protein UY61_C0062G0004 [Candidatus Adlerbacteria bacterium GW2011_GWC1_50_9]OGZ94699.1 MAG: hypothetical protein A2131_00255 [Candidatus Sungbacteria bacterium GWC2_49_10]
MSDQVWCGEHDPNLGTTETAKCLEHPDAPLHELHSKFLEREFGIVALFYCPIGWCLYATPVFFEKDMAIDLHRDAFGLLLSSSVDSVGGKEIARLVADSLLDCMTMNTMRTEVLRRKIELSQST